MWKNIQKEKILECKVEGSNNLFPSKYIHIGGDEAPKYRWKNCSKCSKRMIDENLYDTHELQSYFIQRIENYINNKGKKLIGWDEILEGGLVQGATVQSWRGFNGASEAAKAGHDAIVSPTSHAYFDYDLDAIPYEIELESSITDLIFEGIRLGDVTGNWTAPLGRRNENIIVDNPLMEVEEGQIVKLPLYLPNQVEIEGIDLTIQFDPEVFTFVGFNKSNTILDNSVYNTVQNADTPGLFKLVSYANSNLINEKGLLDLNLLEDELKKGPAVVSVMIVNNEIGVIQPIQEISELCFKYNSLIHSDAAQAIGKIPLNVNELNIAAMSLSAHKFYGPKGIGAFYINREIKNKIEPIIYGGGQEYKIRSGTVPTPLCVGMGEAAMISNTDLIKNNQKVMSHRNNFIKIMDNKLDEYHINGCMDNRILHNLNIRISKVDADELIMNTPVVAFSNGSACSSGEIQSSHVLRSMGLNDQYARESFRISFSHLLSDEEISKAANAIIRSAKKILGSR